MVPVAVVRGMFWSLAEQWSSGLGEPLTEKTGVLPIGALSGESQCGAAGGGSCRRLHSTAALLCADVLRVRIVKASSSLESERRLFVLASSQRRSL